MSDVSEQYESLQEAARSVLENWRDEISTLVQTWMEDFLPDRARQIVVEFTDTDIVVHRTMRDGALEFGRIAQSDERVTQSLSALLAHNQDPHDDMANVVLCLPAHAVLRPVTRLPSAPLHTLRKALAFELERLTPVDPEQVYFDFAVEARDPKTNQVDLGLRILKRETVDSAVAACRAAGLAIGAIVFDDDERKADWRHFPVDRYALLRLVWRRWSIPLLAGLALFLTLCVLFAAYSRSDAAASALDDEIATESTRAAVVERLEHKISEGEAQLNFLTRQKQQPMLVAVLADLTAILPDGTSLSEFEANGSKIRIQGNSNAPSDLIGLIDRSHHFANAQFGAPLVQYGQQNSERFDLAFDVGRTSHD